MLRVDSDCPEKWRYVTRHTILGLLHQMKRDEWLTVTGRCPHLGERLKVGDGVEWFTGGGQWKKIRGARVLRGEVARVLEIGVEITPILVELRKSYDVAFKGRGSREHISYLIAGPRRRNPKGGPPRRKRGLYWPPVHRLRLRPEERIPF